MSSSVDGRRYARRANVDRIFVAHAVSSALLVLSWGWQTKMRLRLGESFDAFDIWALYGPPISRDEMNAGTVGTSPSRLQIGMRAGPSPSGRTSFDLRMVATTVRKPAFSGIRTCNASSAFVNSPALTSR